jgi:hypothetical protein
MSWAKLLASKTVTSLPTTKAELDNLRSIVQRSLNDVAATGLSTDARFTMAYDAARTLSLMMVRAVGYRPRTAGGHYNTFLALEAADPAFAALGNSVWAYARVAYGVGNAETDGKLQRPFRTDARCVGRTRSWILSTSIS